jgi:1,4-dihydroxy-2-naphthoate octaprenyltransferase
MTFREFLSIVELRTKVVSVSSLVVGGLVTVLLNTVTPPPRGVSWLAFALFVVAVLAIDMGTTAFNSFFDHWNGTDRKGRNFEKDKVLVHGKTPAGYALLVALALYAFAACLGLVLAALRGWELVAFGAAGMLVGYLYSGGPRPIATTPFGELFAGGFLGGGLVCLTVYVLSGRFDTEVVLWAMPSTLAVAAILTVNNTCDLENDRDAGRVTLSILLGVRVSQALIAVLVFAAYGWAAILLRPHGWAVVPLALGAGLFAGLYRGMLVRGFALKTKGPNMGAIVRSFTLFTAMWGIALGWGSFFR